MSRLTHKDPPLGVRLMTEEELAVQIAKIHAYHGYVGKLEMPRLERARKRGRENALKKKQQQL